MFVRNQKNWGGGDSVSLKDHIEDQIIQTSSKQVWCPGAQTTQHEGAAPLLLGYSGFSQEVGEKTYRQRMEATDVQVYTC